MKIAVLSDTHDNIPNLIKACYFLEGKNISCLFHCGDICDPQTLETLLEHFSGEIYCVYGNNDYDRDGFERLATRVKRLHMLGETGDVTLGGRALAMTHYPEAAKQLLQTKKFQAVFYGHSHVPWQSGQTELMLNPGTVAGLFARATFAVYDSDLNAAELFLVEKI